MNMFKKLASLLLAVLMLASCFSASAEDLAAQLVDTWIENDGYGTLHLNADGTAVMNYYDDTVTECTWAVTEEGGTTPPWSCWMKTPSASATAGWFSPVKARNPPSCR